MRLLNPNILIGSIIGKAGVRVRETQEASLNASDTLLPNSSNVRWSLLMLLTLCTRTRTRRAQSIIPRRFCERGA
jgi:hypothetical protein